MDILWARRRASLLAHDGDGVERAERVFTFRARRVCDRRGAYLARRWAPGLLLRARWTVVRSPRSTSRRCTRASANRLRKMQPPIVSEYYAVFLEVSGAAVRAPALVAFEFAFDEDDGRIARMEARFAKHDAAHRDLDELDAISGATRCRSLLPKIIPPRPASKTWRPPRTGTRLHRRPAPSWRASFARSSTCLGSYRAIRRPSKHARRAVLLV